MNILWITEVDWTRKPVYDMQLLAESMVRLGHRVYVIDYESMWDGEKSSKKVDVSLALMNANVHLIRPPFIKIPILSRISAFFSHYWEIERTINKKQIQAIILYSVPTNGLQAVYLAKKYSIPIIFRSIDVLNKLVQYPILSGVTKYLEKQVYSQVDKVLTITPKLSDYVISLGADKNKVDVLPMTLNHEIFYPRNTNGYREKWNLDYKDKIILFMGTLFNFSGLDRFIKIFPEIIKRIPLAKLMIVGDGSQRQELEKLVDELGLRDNIIITGFQPYKDMPLFINMADICINTFLDTGATRDIFPGKTVQFLACGKGLIATSLSGMKAVVKGEEQGVIYVDEIEQMVEPIIKTLESDKYSYDLGYKGFLYASEFHRCNKVALKLEKELEKLIKEKNV